MLALGQATRVLVYSAVVDHPRWHELAPALATVSLPPLPEQGRPRPSPTTCATCFGMPRHPSWTWRPRRRSSPNDCSAPETSTDLPGVQHICPPKPCGIVPRDQGKSHREIAHLRTTSPGGTVPLPDQIRDILPADTAMVWEMLAPAIPTAHTSPAAQPLPCTWATASVTISTSSSITTRSISMSSPEPSTRWPVRHHDARPWDLEWALLSNQNSVSPRGRGCTATIAGTTYRRSGTTYSRA